MIAARAISITPAPSATARIGIVSTAPELCASLKRGSLLGLHGMVKVSKLPKWAIKQAGGVNKKAWRLARRGRKATTSPRRRAVQTRRRTPSNPRRRTMARRKMIVPHPSITGMAAGFSLLDDLNQGDVIGQALAGNYKDALTLISSNSQDLIRTPTGRTALVSAVGIAALGAWARKALPATKIGGSKLFFRI